MVGTISGPDVAEFLGSEPPVVNLPAGTKDRPRTDFTETGFDKFIEQHGVRVAWSRSGVCPCSGLNAQTRQQNPLCPRCSGSGTFYFRPLDYVVSEDEAGQLDDLQRFLLERSSSPAVVVRMLTQRAGRKEDQYDRLGTWADGEIDLSYRKENRLAYEDRVTFLDDVMPFSELVVAGAAGVPVPLRFPAVRVDFAASEDRDFRRDEHFFANSIGQFCFVAGQEPAQGTKFSVSYLHHPQFIVREHPHAVRTTTLNTKLGRAPKTPMGDPQLLPLQARAKLEFLP